MAYDGLERYIHERSYGCRISDRYTYKSWKLLVLENELLKVSVLPEKGSAEKEHSSSLGRRSSL